MGPTGIGRTRLLHEVASRASTTTDSSPLTTVVELGASAALQSIPLAALATLIPSVEGADSPPNEVVVRAVQGVARRFRSQRSLLVVDDAHDLDLLSVEVLNGLLARDDLDLTLLLGVSSLAILPGRLSELWTSGHGATVELAAFSLERLSTVVGDRSGDIERLHAETGGYVLLAHEYLESAVIENIATENTTTESTTTENTTDSEREEASIGTAVPARLRYAVDRFLGPLDPGTSSLVEFLSFAGPAPGSLFASIESTLASLERRGIVRADNGMVDLQIPLVGEVIAAGLSSRRRRALNAVMVARFNDSWRARGLELWHLMLWDARGTRTLPAQRYIDATRWALDDRRLDSAGELAAVATSKTNEVVAADVMALQTEVAAAQGSQPAATAYRLMLETTVGRDRDDDVAQTRRVIFNSVLACVRRGDLATSAAIALLEDGRTVGRTVPAVLSIALAEVMWMSGLTGAAATMLDGLARARLDPEERRAYRTMRLTVATESGRCADSVHDAQVALRTLDARHSRQFDITSTNEVLARCFVGLDPDRAFISSTGDNPDVSRSVHAARAITLLLRGRRAEAADLARRFIAVTGVGIDSLGALDDPLMHLTAGLDNGEADRVNVDQPDGTWKRWAELTSAVLAVSGSRRVDARLARGFVDLAQRHLDNGSITTGATIGHLAARIGHADGIAPAMSGLNPGTDDFVLTAMCEQVAATVQLDPVRASQAGAAFSRAGWLASASDSFGTAARLFVDEDDLHAALVAMLAHHLAARSADAASLLSPVPASVVSPREFDVAVSAALGTKSAAIAVELGTSVRTVDNHLYRLYRRFDLGGRKDVTDAVLAARHLVEPGLTSPV